MKKRLVLLCMAIVLALAGCGAGVPNDTTGGNDTLPTVSKPLGSTQSQVLDSTFFCIFALFA